MQDQTEVANRLVRSPRTGAVGGWGPQAAAQLHAIYGVPASAYAKSRSTVEPPPPRRMKAGARPREVSSRRQRTASSTRDGPPREPDDEPPLASLTADQRRWLREQVDQARRSVVAKLDAWRTCARCLREQEPEDFSRGAKYCRTCEAERVAEYRARKAVAA